MISIIAAVDEKRGIGKNGKLPWHIPEDLQRFKEITTGHTVIMGRITFESIGKPLPNRVNIVITSQPQLISPSNDLISVSSLDEAIEKAGGGEIFIIGGGEIFNLAISKADKLYLTQIEGDFNCDTFFPDYSGFTKEKFIGAGEINGIKYSFIELTKV